MKDLTTANRTERLPALQTGTVGQVELPLWIAAAACACAAGLFALGGSPAAVRAVGISAVFWSVLVAALATHAFRLAGAKRDAGLQQWSRKASNYAALTARDDLLFWTLFLLIAAAGVLVPWRPLPFLVWPFKAATVLLAFECARAICRSLAGAWAGRYFDAVLTASPGPQGAAVRVEIFLTGRTGAVLRQATIEIVEVTPDLDPDAGMLGRIVQTASAQASDSGAAMTRFEFALLDDTVFRLATQGFGSWVFSAVSQTRPICVRLQASGTDCELAFAWR